MFGKPLTGFKVLMIALSAFGVIIAVNLFMAYRAVSTFPGIVVDNSYAASQVFDAERDAQRALGWEVATRFADGVLEIEITDADGAPADVAQMVARVGLAATKAEDVTPNFTRNGAVYATPLDLRDGNWSVQLRAIAQDGTQFRQTLALFIRDGRA